MNQKGAILPSVVIFVFLIATLMTGTARIYKNQMQQMMITENYYLIQAMIALSKAEVQTKLAISEDFENSEFYFEDGKVEVIKKAGNTYLFIGATNNKILDPIEVGVTFPNDKEQKEEKKSEDKVEIGEEVESSSLIQP